MAKAARKTATRRMATTRGSGRSGVTTRGRSGQSWGSDIPKAAIRDLASGLKKTDAMFHKAVENHLSTLKTLEPIMKLHGYQFTSEFGTGTQTRAVKTRKVGTRARTGRRAGTQREALTASA